MKIKLLLFLMLLYGAAFAQQQSLSGVVTSKDLGTPLAGVTVKSPLQTVTSDNAGKFTVKVSANQSVTFSYVGMLSVTHVFKGETKPLAVQLEYSSGSLNEVVVTGYQTQKKADVTGAVAVVKMADVKDVPLGSPTKALQGRIPGVYITTNGAPEGGTTVRIRGIGTLNNNDPLYVIDGIPTTRGLEEINQNDIESFQVLKDAASASIYGSRAANGVIIITTKKGKKGFSRIDVSGNASLQYYNTKLSVLNTQQRGEAYWRASVNDGTNPNNNQIYQFDWNNNFNNPVLNKVILPAYIDAAKTMQPADTKWFDEIAQTSVIQNYNVAFSNGSEKGNSFLSMNYYDNNGIVKETNVKKIIFRVNTDHNFFDGRLKVGENLNATYVKDKLIPVSDALFSALVQQPIVPVYTVTGGWGGPAPGMTDRQNPVRQIMDNQQNSSYFGRIVGNVFADLTILPRLHFKTSYGIDYDGTYQRTLRKSYVSGFLADPSNLVNNTQNYDGNLIWQNTLTYDFSYNKHKFDFLAGQESVKFINQNFFGSRQGYALETIDYAYLDAGSTNILNGGNGSAYSLLSYFGKINYAFDNKYLAAVTLRRDGSSRFGENNRYGFFPSAQVGWRISQENFMKKQKFISDLKLRYDYGVTGNQNIGNYATYSLYSAIYGTDPTFNADRGTAYDITGAGTGTLPSGFVKIQQGNPNLKWEETKEHNIGLDFGLMEQKITGSVDYFIKKTSGILITPGYLAVIGEGGTQTFNGGNMQNKGVEVALNYQNDFGTDWKLQLNGNFATFRNKVTYLPSEVLTAYPGNGSTQTILGHSINSIYGYVAQGLFTSQDEVTNSPDQPGKGLGRIRFADLNGDGKIDASDRTFISNGNPDFTYGLNINLSYKNFDLAAFFQGVQGINVYNTYKTYTDFSSLWPGTNWGTRVMDAWSPTNTGSTIPALTLVDRNNEGRTSTYFLENGSYLKMRNLQIGYNLKSALRSIKVTNARVYLQGTNLFTIKSKSFTATDPENPGGAYPIPVITSIGLDLSF
ncbi:SusC/RagA family TonB-linked outer membrane protein [Mucilaginibacter agri]|uniref:SusC/RagA family TonB-linked outer membrane protein n=1 Tax=Mucilaginibacter agri TaxID=2695265 RepID=A0A965ZIJ4_9SPHI|nr:TonB-dependent receptor [Mucilaginibacter agri]NCD71715.1 SusC/RagA family TonB-linked outer membrane protein [Mucilaginibacter agri]